MLTLPKVPPVQVALDVVHRRPVTGEVMQCAVYLAGGIDLRRGNRPGDDGRQIPRIHRQRRFIKV